MKTEREIDNKHKALKEARELIRDWKEIVKFIRHQMVQQRKKIF